MTSEEKYIRRHALFKYIRRLEEILLELREEHLSRFVIRKKTQEMNIIGSCIKEYCQERMVFKPSQGSVENWVIQRILGLGFQCLMAIDLHDMAAMSLSSHDAVCSVSSPISEKSTWSNLTLSSLESSWLDPTKNFSLVDHAKETLWTDDSNEPSWVTPLNQPIQGWIESSSIQSSLQDKSFEPCPIEAILFQSDDEKDSEESQDTRFITDSKEISSFENDSSDDFYVDHCERKRIHVKSHSKNEIKTNIKKDEKTSIKKEPAKRRPNFPDHITRFLLEWLRKHEMDPYPDESDKKELAQQTDLSVLQVNNWFINARRRHLKGVDYRKRKC